MNGNQLVLLALFFLAGMCFCYALINFIAMEKALNDQHSVMIEAHDIASRTIEPQALIDNKWYE